MTRPLRVLSLYEGFFAGGARILHTDVVAGLHAGRDQRHSVLSLAAEAVRESTVQPMQLDPRYLRLARAGVDITTLGRTAGAEPAERSTFTAEELRIAAEAVQRADVVLALKEQPLGLLLALDDAGMLPSIPVAACLHRSDPTHSGPALSWLIEAADRGILSATISCAQSTSEAYARAGVTAPERYVIANGVDTRRFRPGTARENAETRRALGVPADAPVIVFAARFDAMKNPGLFLRAVAAFAADRPDAHFLLCGAGMTWDNEAFRALVDESGISSATRVHALGIRDDMPALYRIADVVALTSAFGEAAPLCLLEGAACGATPVTTAVGDAAREIAGFGVVTPHEAHLVAAAWHEVMAHRSAFRDAALAARPRLGRQRMIGEYRLAIESFGTAQSVAA